MSSPFTIAGAPPALQAIIDARRARIPAGMTMTAGAPEGGDGADGQQQQGGENQQNSGPPDGQQQQGGDDPAALKAEIERLRKENAEKRVRARDADKQAQGKLTDALKALQAAGILPEGIKLDDADPVKVAESAAEEARVAAEKIRARLVLSEAEVAVWRRAQELGLNAAAINDSRSFGDAIAKLDPDADDFASKVIEAAQAAASKNPNLLTSTGVGGKGGSSFSGGSGERRDALKAAPGTSRLEAAYGQSS